MAVVETAGTDDGIPTRRTRRLSLARRGRQQIAATVEYVCLPRGGCRKRAKKGRRPTGIPSLGRLS